MGKNKRILLVDDDPHYLLYLKRSLLLRNYEIVGEAEDSEQAVELFKSEKPDLTLLDYDMPGHSGNEVLEKIRAVKDDALVIMLTGREDIETMDQCLEGGAFHYIRKDYSLDTIYSMIEESLEGN